MNKKSPKLDPKRTFIPLLGQTHSAADGLNPISQDVEQIALVVDCVVEPASLNRLVAETSTEEWQCYCDARLRHFSSFR
jgi:hypothetical protein